MASCFAHDTSELFIEIWQNLSPSCWRICSIHVGMRFACDEILTRVEGAACLLGAVLVKGMWTVVQAAAHGGTALLTFSTPARPGNICMHALLFVQNCSWPLRRLHNCRLKEQQSAETCRKLHVADACMQT